jgi:hypothetical protein
MERGAKIRDDDGKPGIFCLFFAFGQYVSTLRLNLYSGLAPCSAFPAPCFFRGNGAWPGRIVGAPLLV